VAAVEYTDIFKGNPPKERKACQNTLQTVPVSDHLDYELQFHDNHYAFIQLSTYLHVLLALTAFQTRQVILEKSK